VSQFRPTGQVGVEAWLSLTKERTCTPYYGKSNLLFASASGVSATNNLLRIMDVLAPCFEAMID